MPVTTDTSSHDRRALLAELLEQQAGAASFQLSFPQKRLWFLAELLPGNPLYNVPLGYRLRGPLDVEVLEKCLAEIQRRHEVLRTVFRQVGGEVRQIVQPPSPFRLHVVDVEGQEDEAARWADETAQAVIDLQKGPIWRARLLRLGDEDHRLLMTFHHIIFDGWSVGVLLRELSALYRAFVVHQPSPLVELPIQYVDYAHWQHQQLQGEHLEDLLDHWRRQLQGAPSDTVLPSDRPRSDERDYRGAFRSFEIDEDTVAILENVGRGRGATLFMTLLAAFGALLDRYTADDELVLGTLIANRQRAEVEPLIGFFTNTLVLRLDLSGDPDLGTLVDRVKATNHLAYAHQDLPFELLVEALESDRNLARNPLFQVLFSYREGEEAELDLPNLRASLEPGQTETAKFDLTCSLSHRQGRVFGRLEYSTELFDDSTIERLLGQFQTLLAGWVERPERRLSELSILTAGEQELLFDKWNATDVPFAEDLRIEQQFAEQCAKAPEALALVHGDQTLTYGELAQRVDLLARRLRRAGVGAEVPVGILLPRSIDLVVALLAVLEAGGAYLPLDPDYPAERLAFILEDAAAPVVLSLKGLAHPLSDGERTILCLDTAEGTAVDDGPLPAGRVGDADQAAYLIYTSGSTGKPKGVRVSHRNAMNFFTAMDPVVDPATGPGQVGTWLAVTSVSFDISVLELLYTLTRGFQVVIQDDLATLAERGKVDAEAVARHMGFSLFYFGGDPRTAGEERYRLLLDGARFADRHGFEAVWTPERHFHEFGGLFPNPAVTSAAVAAITERVQVRAGSVVLPLHDPIRMAEDWSVIDNISGGRVGLSLAPGWHPNDFALAPDRFAERKQIMFDGLEEVRALWRGEKVQRTSGAGSEVELGIVPLPVQKNIPVWLTSARNPETFRQAGELGAGVLTHLLGHDIDEVAEKIAIYRASWKEHQLEGEGHVTMMLHTFVGADDDSARELARGPLKEYLSTSFGLIQSLGVSAGKGKDFESLPADELDALVDRAVDRFAESAALLGGHATCADVIDRLKAIGVDEVACLIDFGVDVDEVLASLPHLHAVRQLSEERRLRAQRDDSVAAQITRHGVTHLQCTPSLARLLLAEPETRDSLRSLHRLLLGGEALPEPLAAELAALVEEGEVHNMYGPTETTIWSSTHPVTADAAPRGQAVSIGRPIANTRLMVVDGQQRPTPLGVIGELWIGGEGVARGYHARPALTAERFVPDAWSEVPGARLYRTGDLVRYRRQGQLEFHGRLDHQIKIRGHRVELGEIEAVLNECPEVAEAAVVVRPLEDGDVGIVAYCVAARAAESGDDYRELTVEGLRGRLQGKLPEAMIPSLFVFPADLPRTPNGKLDRKSLPDPDVEAARIRRPFAPPESVLEQQLAEIWRQVLNLDQVGVDENFFEIGGNSFLIVQVRSRLAELLDEAPTLVELFRYPTLRTLANALEGNGASRDVLSRVEAAVDKKRKALKRRGAKARQVKRA